MSDEAWTQVIAALVGVAFTVLGRLIDKWLPDTTGKHPLPEPPKRSAETKGPDDGTP